MTIQPSVIVWTVVNFLLLLFVLNRFLFKPMLTLMHRRDEKIRAGIEAGAAAQKALNDQQEKFPAERSARYTAARQAEEALLQQRRQEVRALADSQKDVREAHWVEARDALELEEVETVRRLDAALPELTAVLAEALLKK